MENEIKEEKKVSFWKRQVRILGKTVPVWALATLAMVGLGSAALLTYYGTITANVSVAQSILLDGQNVNTGSLMVNDTITEPAPGGETFCFYHTLKNQASVSATLNLANTCASTLGEYPTCGGVSTNYAQVDYFTVANPDNNVAQYHFERSLVPYDTSISGVIQTINADGSIYNSGYYASTGTGPGFYLLPVPMGKLDGTTISGNGQFAVNVWFDVDKDGIFNWNGNNFVNVSSDGYGFDNQNGNPSGNSTLVLNSSTSIFLTTATGSCAAGTYTLGYIEANCTMDSSTPVYVWVGNNNVGSSTIYSINGVPPAFNTNNIVLQSGQTLQFGSCYSFAINIAPATYTITTHVNPA
jgi:hypothetical protein